MFSDINMPVMGGVEMIEKMSEDDLLRSIPVVVVSTGGERHSHWSNSNRRGVSAYIRKPFTPERLREVVDQIIGANDGDES